jgi:hypothetical protein
LKQNVIPHNIWAKEYRSEIWGSHGGEGEVFFF